MLAYRHEGSRIDAELALPFILQRCREDKEEAKEVFDYMWDVMTGDRRLSKELAEWFFDGPAVYIDPKDEELGSQMDHDYELWRDENVKAV